MGSTDRIIKKMGETSNGKKSKFGRNTLIALVALGAIVGGNAANRDIKDKEFHKCVTYQGVTHKGEKQRYLVFNPSKKENRGDMARLELIGNSDDYDISMKYDILAGSKFIGNDYVDYSAPGKDCSQ